MAERLKINASLAKKKRLSLNLRQSDVAASTGINVYLYNRLERGNAVLSANRIPLLIKLAELLGCSYNELVIPINLPEPVTIFHREYLIQYRKEQQLSQAKFALLYNQYCQKNGIDDKLSKDIISQYETSGRRPGKKRADALSSMLKVNMLEVRKVTLPKSKRTEFSIIRGDRLVELRTERNMTRYDFCMEYNHRIKTLKNLPRLTENTLFRYEHELRRPSKAVARGLAKILEVDVKELLK